MTPRTHRPDARHGARHVLVATTPFGGHQPPLVGLAAELVRRGHAVTFSTGTKYGTGPERVGARWWPWRAARDFDDADLGAAFPGMRTGGGPAAMLSAFEHAFFASGPGQLEDLCRLHDTAPVDLVVGETTCVGAAFLHEARGVPWAGFSLSPITLTSRHLPPAGLPIRPGSGPLGRSRDAVLRGIVGATLGAALRDLLNEARARAGLAPTSLPGVDSLFSPQLQLCQGVPALEYPRPDIPPHLHLIGDAAAGTRAAPAVPEWLRRLDPTRPVVHVTAGTLDGSGEIARSTVLALADTPAQVVVGGDPGLVAAAANVIAPGWVPHDLLLPRTSVFVTNGGYGAVLAALLHGVPVVVAPGAQDKPEVARRVAWAGAGINLRTARPAPRRVRDAVERCLGNTAYRRAAHRVADEFAAAGGVARAADLVEEVLGSGASRPACTVASARPVLPGWRA